MAGDKRFKFALRMSDEAQEMVRSLYTHDNCQSQNEFIEKAVRFYAGYLSAQDNSQYLSDTLINALQGSLDDTENRFSRLLFKLAVEMSMMMNVLASAVEISKDELKVLRGYCVSEVKRTKGRITFDDAVKFQKDK